MPRNGSGTFNRLYNWEQDAANNIKIRADRMDAEMDGMATALTNSIAVDGQTAITANLPMSGFKHTGVADATEDDEYLPLGQANDLYHQFVTPQMFGAVGDGVTDDAPAIQDALDHCFSNPTCSLFFPASQRYFCLTQAAVSIGGDEKEVTIYGEGKSSQIFSCNTTGAIKITSSTRRNRVKLKDISIIPAISDAGVGYEFTQPEGGADARRSCELENVYMTRLDEFTDFEADVTLQYFNNPLVLTGHNRPLITNLMLNTSYGNTSAPAVKRDALVDMDGCYQIIVENSLIAGVATRGISNVMADTNEGGRIIDTNIVGPDYPAYVSQPNRHPDFNIIDSHLNGVVTNAYIENCKYVNIINSLLYVHPDVDSMSEFVDIHFVNCDHSIVRDCVWRGDDAPTRRHVKCEGSSDIVVDALEGLAATVTSNPFDIDATCSDIVLYLPYETASYDFISYPSGNLTDVATGASVIIYKGGAYHAYGLASSFDREFQRYGTADNDSLGFLRWYGDNSAGGRTQFAQIDTSIVSQTDGSERAVMDFNLQALGGLEQLFRLISPTGDGVNTSIFLVVREGSSFNTYQVQVGAADSGGTGFRALRIANA